MGPRADPPLSHSDAAARLRYMAGVRTRARRALLLPSFALLTLGAVVATHGALLALWPHGAFLSLGWTAALVAAWPALHGQRQRIQRRHGLLGPTRLRLACGAAGVGGALLATAVGANPLVSAIALSSGLAAYLAGMASVAIAVVATGAIGDVVFLEGVSRSAAEMLVGAGLIAVGLACLAQERMRP